MNIENKPLIFLGSNRNLLLFVEAAERQNLTIAGIYDKDYFGNTASICGIPIIGNEEVFADSKKLEELKENFNFFIGVNWSPDPGHIRDTTKRQYLIDRVREYDIKLINLIDPTAYVSKYSNLGHGVYVGPGSSIEPDCVIEDFVQIYYQVGIGHGSRIGQNTVLQRKVGIAADIGKNSYLGMWVKVFNSNRITIGNNVIVQPGLYISRNINDNETVTLNKNSIKVYKFMSDPDIGII